MSTPKSKQKAAKQPKGRKLTLETLIKEARKAGAKVSFSMRPNEDALAQEQRARDYSAHLLLVEAEHQMALAEKWRSKRLRRAHQLCQHSGWAFQLAAAFLKAHHIVQEPTPK